MGYAPKHYTQLTQTLMTRDEQFGLLGQCNVSSVTHVTYQQETPQNETEIPKYIRHL